MTLVDVDRDTAATVVGEPVETAVEVVRGGGSALVVQTLPAPGAGCHTRSGSTGRTPTTTAGWADASNRLQLNTPKTGPLTPQVGTASAVSRTTAGEDFTIFRTADGHEAVTGGCSLPVPLAMACSAVASERRRTVP